MDAEQTTQIQIKNDEQMAQLLQEQLNREDEGLADFELAPRALDDPNELAELIDLRIRLQRVRCVKCKTRIHVKADDVIKRAREALRDARTFHPCFRCRDCKGWSCIGEDTYHPGDRAPTFQNTLATANSNSAWCCDTGRLFLVFSLLCGPETISPPTSPNKVTKPRSKSDAVPSSSTQSGQSEGKWRSNKPRTSLLSKGTGYGDCAPKQPTKINRSRASQGSKEGAQDLELYFHALSPLMGFKTFSILRHPALAWMIPRSPILQHASEILRHAAIEEMNTKPALITAVLNFVETVAIYGETCPVLLRPRVRFPLNEQLGLAVLGDADDALESGSTQHETVQSVVAIIEQLAVPCRKFVQTSNRFGGTGAEEDGPLLELMQRICSMAGRLGRLRTQLDILDNVREGPSEPSPSSSRPAANVTTRGMLASAAKEAQETVAKEITKKAADWHRESCVKEIPDDVILKDFHFASLARTAEKSKPAPGRMRKLLAQVSSLSTDLPDGIFVRHGESRVDVLKVLITGPVGTPYEHGIFEFDMFCSAEFPREPPKMFFRTTGEGRVSFNPNLYPTGKICLSLLGTWSGQPWEPERSTILQILVSIQAMIFNDQPFYNEPGYEYHADRARAEEYNRNIESFTVTHAMIPWLNKRLVAPRALSSAPKASTPAPSSPVPSTPASPITPVQAVPSTTASMPPAAPAPAQQPAPQQSVWYQTAAQQFAAHQSASYHIAVQQQLAAPNLHAVNYAAPPPQPTQPPAPPPLPQSFTSAAPEFPAAQMASHFMAAAQNGPLQPAPVVVAAGSSPPMAIGSTFNSPPRPAPFRSAADEPAADDPIWAEVVRGHFGIKAPLIRETLARFEKSARLVDRQLGLHIGELEGLLRRHGFCD
ncbi:hypothetical protein C8A05DRAFT_16463 [Staphylotrichum tortipilum]|uniref:UBC core domain-containing protein n=1 Tax=Staphylotrichum tortipilum TaxID=2831512 RepID=A0AAN6MK45_9PEZI|nr:hypothetical protein C8A05DRAFT_16463 [Staphylotrichum longicolle]